MSASAVDPLSAIATLRGCLDDMADALLRADLACVLACETRLATAVSQVCAPLPAGADRLHIEAEIARTRAALLRCQRLGASLNDFARLTLSSAGHDGAYDRAAQGGLGQTHTFRESI
jgi:hypothetical protein